MVPLYPHQNHAFGGSSLNSGAISDVACEWVTQLCHLVNRTSSRGDAQRAQCLSLSAAVSKANGNSSPNVLLFLGI